MTRFPEVFLWNWVSSVPAPWGCSHCSEVTVTAWFSVVTCKRIQVIFLKQTMQMEAALKKMELTSRARVVQWELTVSEKCFRKESYSILCFMAGSANSLNFVYLGSWNFGDLTVNLILHWDIFIFLQFSWFRAGFGKACSGWKRMGFALLNQSDT